MGLIGCASSKPPEAVVTADVATAQRAIAQAEQANAASHAALQLRTARQKAEQAEAALARGERAHAQRLAEQSALDAQVAEVTARSAKARQAVEEVQESIRALREEAERNTQRSTGQ